MMTKHFGAVFGTVASAALLGLALAATPTSAAYLLNTASAGNPNASLPAGVVDSNDFLALQFSANERWNIDGIEVYLTGGTAGDAFGVLLYSDAAGLPGSLLASATASFNADGWNGVAGLGRPFSGPGLYWLAVEGLIDPISFVPLGSFLAPAGGLSMPGATAFAAGSGYQPAPGVQFGARISGFVPEPGSPWLVLAALAGVGGVPSRLRRRGLAAPGF